MNKKKYTSRIIIFSLIAVVLTAQQCNVQQSARNDCGYVGINQQSCEAKGCCWRPVNLNQQLPAGTPWCYYPAQDNTCDKISYNGTSGPGFDQAFYDKMYQLFDANINIQGKGGVVAAPDPNAPAGSYYYDWMRDGSLSMRTYMEINDLKLSAVQLKMKAYVGWVTKVQKQTDPYGYDIRITPKFNLPDGEPFIGGWCRPQTDGPGLRSTTLMMFVKILLNNSQSAYAQSSVIPLIKYDLEWIFGNWGSSGCDLWQQTISTDLFWNRAAFVYTLSMCEQLFTKLGDSSFVSKCSSAKNQISATLISHWTGQFIKEADIKQKDSSVIHALSSFNIYPLTDDKVAKTIKTFSYVFCSEYQINQRDTKNGEPGILMGRYPGDSYAGGNPWQLLTAVLAKIFYQGASTALTLGFQAQEDRNAWSDLLKLDKNISNVQFAQAALSAGDSVMSRLYKYVKNDGGHITEQIDKNSGVQKSAKDLTWSYANILSAIQQRKISLKQIQFFTQSQEKMLNNE